jgi:hypothetical protein
VRTPRVALLLAVLLATAPATAGAGDAPPIASFPRSAGAPPRAPLAFAVQDDSEFLSHPERLQRTMAELHALGFTHVRLSAHWDQLTRTPHSRRRPRFAAASPGGYEQWKWIALDRAVRAASDHGLQVMVDVAFFAPLWATSGDAAGEPRPRNRVDPRAFADFAVAVAQRYSGRFAPSPSGPSALPRIETLTLWNEPNLAVFWGPQRRVLPGGRIALDSPHAYRRLATRAYAAVKRNRPELRVLVGGLASGPAWAPTARRAGIPALRFLREMACVDAALRPLRTPDCRDFSPVPGDGLAVHPYVLGHAPDFRPRGDRADTLTMGNLDTLSALLRALVERGRIAPALQDVYLTEFGYLTDSPTLDGRGLRNAFPKVGLDAQATFETRAHELAWDHPQVRMFAHFLVRDTLCADDSGPECIDWPSGLRFADGTSKPVEAALEASLYRHPRRDGDVDLWGRLGSDLWRRRGILEYELDGQWQPVRADQVRRFAGGGADGIFEVRVRGLSTSEFRINVR